MLHTLVFIGRSGCGKGTQASLLCDRIRKNDGGNKLIYIETGDHFRQFIRQEGYSSLLSRQAYERDDRQPDFLACWIWGGMLIQEMEEKVHLVFDGAPRAKAEAELLTTAFHFYKRENPTIIHLNVSREWSEEKLLKRARTDDISLSKIDKRLDWFDKDVMPVLEYFRGDPYYKFLEINGEQSIDKVHSDIVAAYEYKN